MKLSTPRRRGLTLRRRILPVGRFFSDVHEMRRHEDGWVAIDTEGTGLDPWGTMGVDRPFWPSRPFAVPLCDPDGNTFFERWSVDAFTRKVMARPSEALRRLLEDESVAKVMFNANYDLRMLESVGLRVRGEIHDVALMAHVIDPDAFDKRLKALCKNVLGMDVRDEADLHHSIANARAKVRAARNAVKKGTTDQRLVDMAKIVIHYPLTSELEEAKSSDSSSNMADCFLAEPTILERYAREDALRTAQLYLACEDELDRDRREGGRSREVYETIERPLQKVVKAMEDVGVRVDKERNEEIISFYLELAGKHRAAIDEIEGEEFNPNSWRQMHKAFFKKRGLRRIRATRKRDKRTRKKEATTCQWCRGFGVISGRDCWACLGDGNQPKCDNEFLAKVGIRYDENDEPVPADELAWHIMHLKAANSMLGFASAYSKLPTLENGVWVLHPNYKQAGPVTGRFACEKPNLQNAATDESGKKKVDVPYRSREPFVPRPGKILYIPDYSQIEIWGLALRSGDKQLLDILMEGGDTHAKIALWVWGKDFDIDQANQDKKLSPEELEKVSEARRKNLWTYTNRRKRSKNLQFCKIYGGGPERVGEMIGCSSDEAKRFIADYDERLPGVREFMQLRIQQAREFGFVENAYGRRYPISRDRAYVAVNYDIQGTAADLIKRAMIKIFDELCCKRVGDEVVIPVGMEGELDLELTIHDELYLEGDADDDTDRVAREIARCMQADHKLLGCDKPFPVGMKIATTRWTENKEFKL